MRRTGHRAVDRDDMHEPGLENLLLTRLPIREVDANRLPSSSEGRRCVRATSTGRTEGSEGRKPRERATSSRRRRGSDAWLAGRIGDLYSFGFGTTFRSRSDRSARRRTRNGGSSQPPVRRRRFSLASTIHGPSTDEDTRSWIASSSKGSGSTQRSFPTSTMRSKS